MWVLYEHSHRKKGIFSQSEKITYSDFLADFTLSASALNAIYRYIQRLGTEESSGCLLQTLKRPGRCLSGRQSAVFLFFIRRKPGAGGGQKTSGCLMPFFKNPQRRFFREIKDFFHHAGLNIPPPAAGRRKQGYRVPPSRTEPVHLFRNRNCVPLSTAD